MATLTEMVAAVVVHSSAAAFSHFGVTVETPRVAPPAGEQRVIARTPAPRKPAPVARIERAADCPDTPPKGAVVKA